MVLRLDGEGDRQDLPLPARRARTPAAHRAQPRHDRQARRAGAKRSERLAEAEAEAGPPRDGDGALLPGGAPVRGRAARRVRDRRREALPARRRSCAATTRCASTRRTASSTWTCRGTARSCRATCTSRRATGAKPLVFYVPGCDQTKEAWPHPYYNQALQRGMHAFSFDGPGQGESNLRGIRLTADNYEEAASAAIDYLAQAPGSRSEEDRRLRALLRLVLGHAHRGEGAPHRRGARRRGRRSSTSTT